MYPPPASHSAGPDQRPPAAPAAWPPYPPLPPPPQHPSSAQTSTGPSQPNGVYYSTAPPNTTLPPLSEHPAGMSLHHPPPPPPAPYRYPPHDPYGRPPPPPDYARAPPHGYPAHPQPAPRQRTAIACRYCRRRKIRCSGFDSSEDGRCSNCQRFSQECVFTPVSAQAQAFVPAHTVYRNGAAPPTQLYGAYGQPLPHHDPYGRPQPYTLPAPNGHYPHPGAAGAYGSPHAPGPAPYDDRAETTRKRPAAEPHTPTLPPPNPAPSSALPRTLAPELNRDYRYPDPTAHAGSTAYSLPPTSSAAATQPYYATQAPPPRASPVLAPPYGANDRARTSSSPSQATPGTPGSASYPFSSTESRLQPPATALPIRNDGRSPPPPSTSPLSATMPPTSSASTPTGGATARPSMSINNLIAGDGASPGDRSTTDKSMLARLGR